MEIPPRQGQSLSDYDSGSEAGPESESGELRNNKSPLHRLLDLIPFVV